MVLLSVTVAASVRWPSRRQRRHETQAFGGAPPEWGKAVAVTMAGLAAGVLAVALWVGVQVAGRAWEPPVAGAPIGPARGTPEAGVHPEVPGSGIVVGIAVVLLAAWAVHVATWGVGRRFRRSLAEARVPCDRAVTSTTDHLTGDPREEVVLAFRDFEHAAARLGVPVDPTLTAGEIANHPLIGGLGEEAAIVELTQLFRRARYSRTVITVADVRDARSLLGRIVKTTHGLPEDHP